MLQPALSRLWSFMKHKRWWLIAATALLVMVALWAFAYPESGEEDLPEDAHSGVAVQVVPAEYRDIWRIVRVAGKVNARLSVDMTPKTSGTVTEVRVGMGDHVEEGDVLVVIDDGDVRTHVAQAEAGLEMARAQVAQMEKGATEEEIAQLRAVLDQAEAAVDMARWSYERMEELYRGGAVSRLQMEEATLQYRSAETQLTVAEMNLKMALDGTPEEALRMARAQLREAEAAVDLVGRRMEDTVIRAPASGQIAYVLVDPGDTVSPGMGVVGLVDTDPVYMDASVSERVIGFLNQGDVIEVEVAAISETFDGILKQVAPAADPRSGMFPVRIAVENPEGRLKPGMLAELVFVTEGAENVLAVLRRAVIAMGTGHHVFVVVDGRAQRRRIEIGLDDDEYVEVTAGLSEGERVVESGADFLEDGTVVEVIEGR